MDKPYHNSKYLKLNIPEQNLKILFLQLYGGMQKMGPSSIPKDILPLSLEINTSTNKLSLSEGKFLSSSVPIS